MDATRIPKPSAQTLEQSLRAGRRPKRVSAKGLWLKAVLEVRPENPKGGTIAWQWRLWEHLIRDFDPGQSDSGEISGYSELIDIKGDRTLSR